jgi:hypothetical protein
MLARVRYAELHCRSNFSFLAGGSHPHELVQRAGALGLEALAITDLSGLYGVVRAWDAARELEHTPPTPPTNAAASSETGPHCANAESTAPESAKSISEVSVPRLIYGSELELDPQRGPASDLAQGDLPKADHAKADHAKGDHALPSDALVLLARSAAGYAQISQLITRGGCGCPRANFRSARTRCGQWVAASWWCFAAVLAVGCWLWFAPGSGRQRGASLRRCTRRSAMRSTSSSRGTSDRGSTNARSRCTRSAASSEFRRWQPTTCTFTTVTARSSMTC